MGGSGAYALASDYSGENLVAGVQAGQLWVSHDGGTTWTAHESNRYWNDAASSSTGNYLFAAPIEASSPEYLYASFGTPGNFACLVEPGDVSGFSGLTPGARQWGSQSTPGALTEVEPTSGQVRRFHGWAKSATSLRFDPRGFEPQQNVTPAAARYLNEFGQMAVPVPSGVATLAAGVATVSTALVTASSRILLTIQTPGGTLGMIYENLGARVPGTSFEINSVSVLDTSTIVWAILEP